MMDAAQIEELLTRLGDRGIPLTYEQARKIAACDDAMLRARLAARLDAPHEVLYYLASDASPEVRRAVAANSETPIQAELQLAGDKDEAVRIALAEKVARGAAARSADEQPSRAKLFFELLKALARDELARIRRVISQAIKDIANIPGEIVRGLAADEDSEVAAPVLRDSPVLREGDLIEAMEARPVTQVVSAVAERAAVGPILADAVVATGDQAGIAALLANESAQIREETLDRLIEASANVPAWQGALVERPRLSAGALARLAQFIAAALSDKLTARGDLDPSTLREIETIIAARVARADGAAPALPSAGSRVPAVARPEAAPKTAKAQPKAAKAKSESAPKAIRASKVPSKARDTKVAIEAKDAKAKPEEAARHEKSPASAAIEKAKALLTAGKLDEDAVAAAVAQRDRPLIVASLALKAKLPLDQVNKILSLGGSKGITALVWKAGFGMRVSSQIQTRIAGIAPNKALYAKQGVNFPLTEEEMRWHLEFFDAA